MIPAGLIVASHAAVDPRIGPEQRIPAVLLDTTVSEYALVEITVVIPREPTYQRRIEPCHIRSAHILARRRQAGHVNEMRMRKIEPFGVVIHVNHERARRTGDGLRELHRCVVARHGDQTMQELIHRDLVTDFEKHLRAVHAPGFLADGDLGLRRKPAPVHRVEHDIADHQFGEAGRGDFTVRMLGDQCLSRPVGGQDIA